MEKLTKNGESGKNRPWVGKYENWMTKVVSWRVAVMTRMANRTKIVKPASKNEIALKRRESPSMTRLYGINLDVQETRQITQLNWQRDSMFLTT